MKKQTPRICVKYTSAKLSKSIYNFPNLKSRIQNLRPRFLSSDRISFKGKEICLIKNIFFLVKTESNKSEIEVNSERVSVI